MSDPRLFSPATARNREPLRQVLVRVLPAHARVLEIASGSGEHARYFASRLPGVQWQPSDADDRALESIRAWQASNAQPGVDTPGAEEHAPASLLAPVALNVIRRPWPQAIGEIDAMVCINMIHIAPWAAAEALFGEAGERLPAGGVLVLYGPFRRHGHHSADSNAAFDQDLRQRDQRWGVRDLEDEVVPLAEHCQLALDDVIAMPAHNLCVVFRRQPG